MTDLNLQSKDRLRNMWRATFLRRWHRNPDLSHTTDTLAGHQGRVAIIINHHWPNVRKELIVAALHHDMQESRVGDMCGQAKRDFPELAKHLARVEAETAEAMNLPNDISEDERQMLKYADKLDALFWAEHHAPQIMDTPDWLAAKQWLYLEAESLGLNKRNAA